MSSLWSPPEPRRRRPPASSARPTSCGDVVGFVVGGGLVLIALAGLAVWVLLATSDVPIVQF
ncbi:hypothetical protein AB0K43_08075 [Kitasatospora sp. NPDC049258]|uniref:hypothetical protein n=1 Tax=Kitasatospora sp. NPDC049258 TaxID=3155394 RepID=UPI0034385B11